MASKSFSSLFLTLGIAAPLAGGIAATACTSKFEGCAASRTCDGPGEGGDGGTGGKGGSAGRGGGSAGKGGGAGNGGAPSMGGEGGEAGGSAASGGKGGTSGQGGTGGVASAGKGGQGGKGGSGDEGGEGGRDSDPEPDVTPPTIVSVSPADGETGVMADTVIRITFSEPMVRGTAEAAYQSADIPSAATTKRWSSDDTVLTITPNDELAYSAGAKNDLAFAAKVYAVEMTDTAEDEAGNRLVPKSWNFTTLRRFNQVLTADGNDVRRYSSGANRSCGNLDLGDYRTNETLAGFVQFDLSELAPGTKTFESATLYGERIGGAGNPRALSGIHLAEFEEDITTADLETPTGPDLGVFLDSLTSVPSMDVLPAMTSSYAADGLVQFRLRALPDTDGDDADDYFRLLCALDLSMIYLAP
jgi:hypothetical protein